MNMLVIHLDVSDGATPALAELRESLQSSAVLKAIGTTVVEEVRRNFIELDGRGNRLSGRSTGYYERAADSTHWQLDAEGLMIIAGGDRVPGLVLHFTGGTVVPVKAKHLAIPARSESHGTLPGEWDNLQVLWGRNGPYALAYHQEQPRMRKDGKGRVKDGSPGQGYGEVLFWLCDKAEIPATEHLLPTDDEILEAAERGGQAFLDSQRMLSA